KKLPAKVAAKKPSTAKSYQSRTLPTAPATCGNPRPARSRVTATVCAIPSPRSAPCRRSVYRPSLLRLLLPTPLALLPVGKRMPGRLRHHPPLASRGNCRFVHAIEQIEHPVEVAQPSAAGTIDQEQEA